jgi:hypothetical protein
MTLSSQIDLRDRGQGLWTPSQGVLRPDRR